MGQAAGDLPETVRQVVVAPGAPSPSTKATASVRVASEAVKPPDGHWGKMSTGQWAWLSEIRSPIAEHQEFPRSIVPPNLKYRVNQDRTGYRKAQGLPAPFANRFRRQVSFSIEVALAH